MSTTFEKRFRKAINDSTTIKFIPCVAAFNIVKLNIDGTGWHLSYDCVQRIFSNDEHFETGEVFINKLLKPSQFVRHMTANGLLLPVELKLKAKMSKLVEI